MSSTERPQRGRSSQAHVETGAETSRSSSQKPRAQERPITLIRVDIAVSRGRGEHIGSCIRIRGPRTTGPTHQIGQVSGNNQGETTGSNRRDAAMACGRKSSMSMLYLAVEAEKEPKTPPSRWVHQRIIITRPGTPVPSPRISKAKIERRTRSSMSTVVHEHVIRRVLLTVYTTIEGLVLLGADYMAEVSV